MLHGESQVQMVYCTIVSLILYYYIPAVYLSGVLAGSLWTSVIKPEVFLSGASGGVYALITAHLGTVIMNHREMSHPWVRVGVVSLTAATDICVYIYQTAGNIIMV